MANTPKLRIIPLGGVDEIGKNMTVFEYDRDIIVVDCGSMFPKDDMLGIDLVIPDASYLVANKERVRGYVFTHGHEDHIGAVPYVVSQVPAPLYGSRLTLALMMQQAVADYPAVEEKYRTYSRKWMEDSAEEGLVTVDRTEVLTMVEKYLRTQGTVKSLSIQGTVMVVNMSDMNLRQISAMLAKVEQQPLVAKALLNVASSEDQETTEILDFTVTIALQPVEEEE